MRKILFLGLALGLVVLLGVNLSYAAIRTVCASGCGYTSIQAAVDAAAPFDTIQVSAGYYYENVLVNKQGLIIQGADRLKTFVFGEGTVFEVTAPQVEISGFTISGWDGYGVFINGGGGAVEAPVKKAPSKNAPVQNVGAYGAWIHDNIIEKNSTGVMVYNSSEVQIGANHVRNNTAYWESCWPGIGIVISSGGEDMFNIKITGNAIYDNDSYGIQAESHGYLCGDAPVKEPPRSAPDWCGNRFDGMQVTGNRLYNNGAWDAWNPFDQNSRGFYFHTHESMIAFVNNKILATSTDGITAPSATVNGGGNNEFQYSYTSFDCWQWSGNVIFGELLGVLRGGATRMPKPEDGDR